MLQAKTLHLQVLDNDIALYSQAFAPYTKRTAEELRLMCTALLGAAEAITRELSHGRIRRPAATEALAGLIVRALR